MRQNLTPTRDPGLVAIAVFKLFKGVTLIALGLGAFRLLNPVTVHRLVNWLLHFSLTTGQRFIDRAIDLLSKLTRGHAAALGLGAILYGSLFTVEGVGLWKGKRWAEYLTVIATSTLIPFEVYELARRLTMVRVSALVVNVAAVIYLVYRLRHPREASDRGPRHRRLVVQHSGLTSCLTPQLGGPTLAMRPPHKYSRALRATRQPRSGLSQTLALTLTTKALNSSKAFFACALNKRLTRGPTG